MDNGAGLVYLSGLVASALFILSSNSAFKRSDASASLTGASDDWNLDLSTFEVEDGMYHINPFQLSFDLLFGRTLIP